MSKTRTLNEIPFDEQEKLYANTATLLKKLKSKSIKELLLEHSESKKQSLYYLTDDAVSGETLEDLQRNLHLFKKITVPNTSESDTLKKGSIYKLVGEIEDTHYISFFPEDNAIFYIIGDIVKIKCIEDLISAKGRELHTNDVGKNVKFIKNILKGF